MEFIIKPSYTAITNGASKSAKLLAKDIKNDDIILDYGCGKLRNTLYLKDKNKNISIDIFDLEEQIKSLEDKKIDKYIRNTYSIPSSYPKCNHYDKILCSFVINVVEDQEERIKIMNNCYKYLKENGTLYIEVRTFNFLKNLKHYDRYKDGYLVGKNKIRTFQKPFGTAELYNLIVQSQTKYKLRNTITHKDSIILVLEK